MSRFTGFLLVALAMSSVACAKKNTARVTSEVPRTTSAEVPRTVNPSEELIKKCQLRLSNVDQAPKFDFDEAALLPDDRELLQQVARCVTTGPLKGRKLALVGRADPRGEVEYNMALGDHRAESVRVYLTHLGVGAETLDKTSRGELDAEGQDEDGWRRDRRVDIDLQ